jgi:hypothetical protein
MKLSYTLPGCYSTDTAKRIKEKLEGKTFFNFQVEFGGIAHNNQIIIMSDAEGYADQDLAEMAIFYAFNEI